MKQHFALTRRVCRCQDESQSLLQTVQQASATSESSVGTSQAAVQTEAPALILELKKEAELVLIDDYRNVLGFFFLLGVLSLA